MFYASCNIFNFHFSLPCMPIYWLQKQSHQGENAANLNKIGISRDATAATYVFL